MLKNFFNNDINSLNQILEELYLDHEEDTLIYYLYLLSVVLNPDFK